MMGEERQRWNIDRFRVGSRAERRGLSWSPDLNTLHLYQNFNLFRTGRDAPSLVGILDEGSISRIHP